MMNYVRVKVCGITSEEDLQIVVDAGVDAVGCVINVSNSPRSVSLAEAKRIFQKTPPFVTTVAVLVVDDPSLPKQIYNELKPDVLQLHAFDSYAQEIRHHLPNTCII
ncbi:MAG: phosphoribosylanthranilate isomerase, partial [Candidatus Ranarchaeia archaeon]